VLERREDPIAWFHVPSSDRAGRQLRLLW
jgi:hypothetical protein